jgi:hypothetical protein
MDVVEKQVCNLVNEYDINSCTVYTKLGRCKHCLMRVIKTRYVCMFFCLHYIKLCDTD